MPLSELLDETFKLYRRHFNVIAGVSIAIILPGLLIALISGSYRANPFSYFQQVIQNVNNPEQLQQIQNRQAQFGSSPLYLLSFPIGLLLAPFSLGAVFYAATSLAAGNVETIGSVLLGTARRYFAIFGVIILSALVGLGGVAIVTIPLVIWVLIRWAVALPAMFGEKIGPVNALGRSWNLTKGNWWRILGLWLIVAILVSIIEYAMLALFGGITALIPGLGDDLRAALVTTVTDVVSALVGAVSPIVFTLLYLDLRVRKEGLDLDQLARQAAPGPAPA
jgi:Membrane domain of glycerophosphoryl diester phosphodiesterase